MAVNLNGKNAANNVLGLAPMHNQSVSVLGFPPVTAPDIPMERAITRREGQIVQAFHEDVLIMDGTALKAEYGMFKLGEIQQCASYLFGDTVSILLNNRNDLKGTDAEPFMNEFALRGIQMYARHMIGVMEIAGTRIGEQAHSSLDLPVEKPTWIQRLLGWR